MDEAGEFSKALKEAVGTQNRRDIDRLTSDPLFQKISSEGLGGALSVAGPLMQDMELLPRFIDHPNFKNISAEALAKTFLLAIPLPYGPIHQTLLYHDQMQNISQPLVEEIVKATLEFQDRRMVADLNPKSTFKPILDKHLADMVHCAIRMQNVFWLDEIVRNPEFKKYSALIFTDLMRWALRKKDENIIKLAIRTHHFTPESETFLRQELIDTFREEMDEVAEAVVDELVVHPDYPHLSPILLSWILMMAVLYEDDALFANLVKHVSYARLSPNRLADLFVLALSINKTMATLLAKHPHFVLLSGSEVGLALEELNQDNIDLLPLIIHHPHFAQVPEDHFKRMAAMDVRKTSAETRNAFLSDPLFKIKYGEMVYEAIRRNDCEFISNLLGDEVIKKEVVKQLYNYAGTDNYFVSEYTIRDVMREIFLTNDQTLISEVAATPVFEKRIPELAAQSIQFDDEQLIENLLLNPRSKKILHEVIQKTSPQDKERIHRIFSSTPSFNKRPPEFIREVNSWIQTSS